MKSQIILGIDPGFRYTGFGILKKENNKIVLIDCGCLKLLPMQSLAERISIFNNFFTEKITQFLVTDIALEKPFLWKNADTFLKLGYLRGILQLLSWNYKLSLHEFSPREVKQAVTGYGAAQKEQVSNLLLRLFPRLHTPEKNDITDAIAVALCCAWINPSLKKYAGETKNI